MFATPTPRSPLRALSVAALSAILAHCGTTSDRATVDPDAAAVVSVDRFQDSFATLFKRSAPAFDPVNVRPRVPAPNAPIDFDQLFRVRSLGPGGERVMYYSLDVVPVVPGRAYVILGPDGETIPGQLPVLTGVPGDAGYNDFMRITEVRTEAGYNVNSLTSEADVLAAVAEGEATATLTTRIVDWAVVPAGSTATMRFQGNVVTGYRAWVRGMIAPLMQFETDLRVTAAGRVPGAGIVVIFRNDADPSMGFATDADGMTHNVVQVLPGQPGYSSLWSHLRGNLAGFDGVRDWATALANAAGPLPVNVNCPMVSP